MPMTLLDKRKYECQQCQNEHSKSHQIFKVKRFLVHQHHPILCRIEVSHPVTRLFLFIYYHKRRQLTISIAVSPVPPADRRPCRSKVAFCYLCPIFLLVQEESVRRQRVHTSKSGKRHCCSCKHCFAQIVLFSAANAESFTGESTGITVTANPSSGAAAAAWTTPAIPATAAR